MNAQHRRRRAFQSYSAALTVAGALLSGCCDAIVPEAGRFSIGVDRAALDVSPGSSATIVVRTHRERGFAGAVRLSVRGLPQGAVAELAHSKGLDDTCLLTVRTEAWVMPSEQLLTVIGTAPGLPPHGVALPLRIGGAPAATNHIRADRRRWRTTRPP
jgi:hypothetical protein